jgi:hypothetical protein
VVHLGVLLAALFLTVGSGTPGDRAESGVCPPDEDCSAETPGGLYFEGPTFGDVAFFPSQDIKVTAVHGTQTVLIEPVNWDVYLGAFKATCSGDAFSVVSVDHGELTVTLSADAAGTSKLRILDSATEELFDRVSVYSAQITSAHIEPLFFEVYTDDVDALDSIFYGGKANPWIVRLYGSAERLVDESLTFAPGDATSVASIVPLRWDMAAVRPTDDATRVAVQATTGDGQTFLGEVFLTHEIDTIETHSDWSMPQTLEQSHNDMVCFFGLLGTTLIRGLDWSAEMVKPDDTVDELAFDYFDNCTSIGSDQLGTHIITVSAANLSREFSLTVTPESTPLPPVPLPPPMLPPPMLPAVSLPLPSSPSLSSFPPSPSTALPASWLRRDLGTPGDRAKKVSGTSN